MNNNAIAEIRTLLEDKRMTSQLAEMLNGTPVTVAKFRSVAMTAIVNDPDLLAADRTSLLTACVDCARAGLLPDAKEAAFVVRNTKKKILDPASGGRKEVWIQKVTYSPMVRGLYKLANSSGDVRRIRAHMVHADDEFSYEYGAVPFCKHRPASGKATLATHVYAIAVLNDGSFDLEVMTIAEVNEVRQWSKNPKGSAWGDGDMPYGEMCKKTVLHRICKRLDLDPEASAAVDMVEGEYDLGTDAPRLERPTGDGGLSMFDDIVNDKDDPGTVEKVAPDGEKAARAAAMLGHDRLDQHLAQLPPAQAVLLQPLMPDLRIDATAADVRKERQ